MNSINQEKFVLLSLVYQLLDNGAEIHNLNPNVKRYIEELLLEFNTDDPEEQKHFELVYNYADVYFNSIYNNKGLH